MPNYTSPEHFHRLMEEYPDTICKKTGCSYDEKNKLFSIDAWTVQYEVDPGGERIYTKNNQQPLHDFFEIFLLHYLIEEKTIQPTGEWISEKDMTGGVTFFRGPHDIPTDRIVEKFGNDIDRFGQECEKFSGSRIEMADMAYRFEIFPNIHVALLYWIGDEDFPAEAKILYDSSLLDVFALDVIFALAIAICDRFADGIWTE
ncbi:DUF3786 domain-containing protein [Desulfobacula phenolica]|uniref:DUF3786 domain-containing protein n=1 Tax=Desulfobacula phenolica TaxID=90732 RepID=A0A1H2IN72_9BACT|nr:DUF3786 domain-containing protein [Desulfobacula phenolica]SDU45386.1 protein of unknown function [Desulfobacula phenolica]